MKWNLPDFTCSINSFSTIYSSSLSLMASDYHQLHKPVYLISAVMWHDPTPPISDQQKCHWMLQKSHRKAFRSPFPAMFGGFFCAVNLCLVWIDRFIHETISSSGYSVLVPIPNHDKTTRIVWCTCKVPIFIILKGILYLRMGFASFTPTARFFFLAYFNVGQPLFCTHAFCRHTCRIYLQNKTQDDFKVGSCLFTTEDISIIQTCQVQDKGTTTGTQKMCRQEFWILAAALSL